MPSSAREDPWSGSDGRGSARRVPRAAAGRSTRPSRLPGRRRRNRAARRRTRCARRSSCGRCCRATFIVATPGLNRVSSSSVLRARDDLVVLGGDQQRRRGDRRQRTSTTRTCRASSHLTGKNGKARGGDLLRGCRTASPARARATGRTLATRTATPEPRLRPTTTTFAVLAPGLVEQGQRIGDDRRFRRRAGAPAVAAVVEQVQRVARERIRQARHAARHVLAVAAEVDDGIGTDARPHRGDDLGVGRPAARSSCRDFPAMKAAGSRGAIAGRRAARRTGAR